MSGKDLYGENKRLKQQLEGLRNRYLDQRRGEEDRRERVLNLVLDAVEAFLEGRAHFVSELSDNDDRIIYLHVDKKP